MSFLEGDDSCMSNKLEYIFSIFTSTVFGFILAVVFLKLKPILEIIRLINFVSLAYWLSIIIGALVSALLVITATYFTVKKQEIIKLKAKVIERNIDTVYQLIQVSKILNTMVLQDDKKKNNLEFEYNCDLIDEWPISIPHVLTEEFHTASLGWYANFLTLMDDNTGIMNLEIIHYEHFIKEYFYNLYLTYDKIPIDKRWQMAFALKPDFREICNEFTQLLEDYLQNDIYKMNRSKKRWDLNIEESYKKKLKKTNLVKYGSKLESLIR